MQNLTRTLAMEWAPHGILVNCIAPGPIDTPEAADAQLGTPEMKKQVEASTALNRLGKRRGDRLAVRLPGVGGGGLRDRSDLLGRRRPDVEPHDSVSGV